MMQNAEPKPAQYFAFIDGLRAVAICLVLLFHFDLFRFPGGFFGVDVFFVISGFLVSGIIFRDLHDGRFSFISFYRRRIMRIFPALYASLFVVILLAYFFQLPPDAIQSAESARASALFVTNHYFYNNINYFNKNETGWFLLHHWSLSVEEQFYIFFPIGLLILFKLRLLKPIFILILTVVSLVVYIYIFRSNIGASFYFAIARFWEFLFGVSIAVSSQKIAWGRWKAEIASATGLAMIIGAAVTIANPAELFGLSTVLPVAGTALILHANISKIPTFTGSFLRLSVMRFLGKISYSVYLVHWPILIFAQYISVLELSVAWRLSLLMLSVAIGWISWLCIEVPFRRNSWALGLAGWKFAGLVITATVGLIVSATWVIDEKSRATAISPTARLLLAGKDDYSPNRLKCHVDAVEVPVRLDNMCRLGGPNDPTIAMWSDSHGVELVQAVSSRLQLKNRLSILQLTTSSCPPLNNWNSFAQPRCKQKNDAVLAFMENSSKIDTVILTMRFDGYPQSPASVTLNAMARTVDLLAQSKKRVIIVAPFPKPEFDLPNGMARAEILSFVKLPESKRRSDHDQSTRYIRGRLRQMASRYGAVVIDPADTLCSVTECRYTKGGKPLYFDDNHPSMTGVATVASEIARAIESDYR